jgi:hypothetical protein
MRARVSDKFLNKLRRKGDGPADRLIASTFSKGNQDTLYGLLKLNASQIEQQSNTSIRNFLITKRVTPSWFDLKRVHNGQKLFKHYALEMMGLLGAMSLPYCYAASPGNKALYLSDKMRNSPGKRLLDTASFVIEVLAPGNLNDMRGHIHINKVRLIHALSRYFIKKHPQWDLAWGIPINQEDMAGTNLAFSYMILLGMQQSGHILSQREKEDFLFVWRYIGYLLNIQEEVLPASFLKATQLTTLIKRRNFKKTEEGIILTSELLSYYKTTAPPAQANLLASQIRFYLGREVADMIGISSDSLHDRIVFSIGTLKSLRNMLSVHSSSYERLLMQHSLLRKGIILGN